MGDVRELDERTRAFSEEAARRINLFYTTRAEEYVALAQEMILECEGEIVCMDRAVKHRDRAVKHLRKMYDELGRLGVPYVKRFDL